MHHQHLTSHDWNETRPANMRFRNLIRVLPEAGPITAITPVVGQILSPYFSSSPATPAGWMDCDGRLLSCEHYPDLFAALGYRFGNAPTITVTKRLTFAQRLAIRLGLKIAEPERFKIPNPQHQPGYFALPDFRGHFLKFS